MTKTSHSNPTSSCSQAVILAGGKGTRLSSRLGDLPKSMIQIGGKPLLQHQIEVARDCGISEVLILAGYRAEAIQDYFGDGKALGVSIQYEVERTPLGTAGALLAARHGLAEHFVVIYGDEMLSLDLQRLCEAHLAAGADATLLLHPNDHPLDSDLVEIDSAGWITALHSRPHPADQYFQNLVNAALYVIRKAALDGWAELTPPVDLGKDLFPAMLARSQRLLGYRSLEYVKDIGTPERYDRVCKEYAAGVVQRSSYSTPQPAVFLDRDGTLNREVGGVMRPEDLELIPGVAAAVQSLNRHGIRAIVITNQPIVAKGFCSETSIQLIHNKLETLLGRQHAFLDRIYWCPHHPEKGFPGERPDLKVECDCRKPKTGLIKKAKEELKLDLKASWLIGDSSTDLQTARNAGIRSILLQSGHGGKDGKYPVKPDYVFETLADAVQFIVEQNVRT